MKIWTDEQKAAALNYQEEVNKAGRKDDLTKYVYNFYKFFLMLIYCRGDLDGLAKFITSAEATLKRKYGAHALIQVAVKGPGGKPYILKCVFFFHLACRSSEDPCRSETTKAFDPGFTTTPAYQWFFSEYERYAGSIIGRRCIFDLANVYMLINFLAIDEDKWIEENKNKIHRMNTDECKDGVRWHFPRDVDGWPKVPEELPEAFDIADKRELLRAYLTLVYCKSSL